MSDMMVTKTGRPTAGSQPTDLCFDPVSYQVVPLQDYFELLNSSINRNENMFLTLVEVSILVLRSTKLYFHLLVVQLDPSVFKSPPLVSVFTLSCKVHTD